jgi:hypothetical protein
MNTKKSKEPYVEQLSGLILVSIAVIATVFVVVAIYFAITDDGKPHEQSPSALPTREAR